MGRDLNLATTEPEDNLARTPRLNVMLTGGLGDCLLASAFIRQFHEQGAYSEIVCALPRPAVELYDRNPHVTRVVPCDGKELFLWGLPEEGADVFAPYAEVLPSKSFVENGDICLHVNRRIIDLNLGTEPVWQQVAAFHRISMADGRPEIFFSTEDEEWAEGQVRAFDGKRVLINYQSPLPEKHYPLGAWQAVVDGLKPETAVLEFVADGSMLRGTERITPMPGPRRSAALVKKCDCVLTIDSFAGHLAAAVGTPAVVLFGPTNPLVWGHEDATRIRPSGCAPCANTPRLGLCEARMCMREIDPSTVIEAVLQKVREPRTRLTEAGHS